VADTLVADTLVAVIQAAVIQAADPAVAAVLPAVAEGNRWPA